MGRRFFLGEQFVRITGTETHGVNVTTCYDWDKIASVRTDSPKEQVAGDEGWRLALLNDFVVLRYYIMTIM